MFIVTGGGSGIGRALACALAARGQRVLVVGRSAKTLAETADFSHLIQAFVADVSLSAGRDKLVAYLDDVPVIHGLIHNAGIIDPIVSLSNIDEPAWRACMKTNVDAPLFLTQMLMSKLVGGRVLNIGSGAAYFPVVGWSAYCVSKAALAMLTRCWQLECSQTAFASVMPGIIDTPMQAIIRNAKTMQPEKRQFFNDLKQNNQLISPETVAAFLSWLLFDVDPVEYASQEWDIYDTSHHAKWLVSPHVVPEIQD